MVEPKWLGNHQPHRVLCKSGHLVNPRPTSVLQGQGLCRICAGHDPATAEKAFHHRVAELGGRVVEPQWLGANSPHQIICARDHRSNPRPSDVVRGHGICRVCAKNDPATAEHAFSVRVTELGGQVVESTWLGNARAHRVICKEGHETTTRPSSVVHGRQGLCRVCARNDPATAERAFHARVAQLGGRVVEPAWLGSNAKHRVICKAGHQSTTRPAPVLYGQGICRICAGNDPASAEQAFRARVAELGGHVLEPVWLGTGVPHRVICKKGHKRRPTPSSVQQGNGICRACSWTACDVFYVVANEAHSRVKFGIASGNPRTRLGVHRRAGYQKVICTISNLSNAVDLERVVLRTLQLAGLTPVQGWEYFDTVALAVISDVVDNWERAR